MDKIKIDNVDLNFIKGFINKHFNKARILEGDEHKHIWLSIHLLDPMYVSNNQQVYTEIYSIADKEYHVTYINGIDPIIEEIIL
jgi:hypothetical protein